MSAPAGGGAATGRARSAGRARRFVGAAACAAFGGLFVFSGATKLRDPQLFAFALKSLDLGLGEDALIAASFGVPWWEIVAGTLLAVGVWRRAAATLIVGLLTAFTAVIAASMARRLAVDCPCFGAFELVCTGPLGGCHLVRNVALGLCGAAIAARSER